MYGRPPIPARDIEAMVHRRMEGVSLVEVAAEFGYNACAVSRRVSPEVRRRKLAMRDSLGADLRRKRLKAGLSIREAAAIACVCEVMWGAYERDEFKIPARRLKRVNDYFERIGICAA